MASVAPNDLNGSDPWWWSLESAFPSSVSDSGDPVLDGKIANARIPPGETLYRYVLSRDLTMENVQFVVEGMEFHTPGIHEQLRIKVQLVNVMGELLLGGSVNTETSSMVGNSRTRWGEFVVVPFRISDLPENAALHLSVYGPPEDSFSCGDVFIGAAFFPLFSPEGRLRTGKQEIQIFSDCSPPERISPSKRKEEVQRAWSSITADFEKEETQRKAIHKSESKWLNTLAEERIRVVRRARRLKYLEKAIGVLAVELQDFGFPVVFEPDEEDTSANTNGGLEFVDDISPRAAIQPSGTAFGELIYPEITIVSRTVTIRNVVESKCYAMRRSLTRKSAGDDPHLRPNVDERDQIERILISLSRPTSEEEDLLWKFRHSLVRNSKALTKVLASVKWEDPEEVVQVTKLLDKWEAAQVSDVLRLISGDPEFSHPVVRAYAVKVLSHSKDAVLLLYMPQLVQALRYDLAQNPKQVGDKDAIPPSVSVIEPMTTIAQAGPLQRFLVTKCSANEELASAFHWYLKVEVALAKSNNSAQSLEVFQPVQEAFQAAIATHQQVFRAVLAQDDFVQRIMGAARAAASITGKHAERTKVFMVALEREDRGPFPEPIPLAGFPGKRLVRMKRDSARIMKSKTSPAVLDFVVQNANDGSASTMGAASMNMDESTMTVSRSTILSKEPQTIRIMFKVGDDLRQDQLMMQLMELMDNIFRENGLDLEMTIFHVLATAPKEGLIEFVPDAIPLSKVIDDFGSITTFLNKEEHMFGGRRAVIERFIRSCAGYSVATYVLGIGDRHLDNILLRPNGHMFHIDFGYTFGRDPKYFTVDVRILPQMIETMGVEGERTFRRHCWEALKALRAQAPLILSVIGLMVDASIPDLSRLQTPAVVLAGIQERLKLGMSDEEAERSLNTTIDQSIVALGPRFNDKIHQLAQLVT